MLGYVVAAISPAVVVPSILALQEAGYGTKTGIPTMVVASAALDDVYAISGFGVCFALSFGGGSLAWKIARAPVELVGGIGLGWLCGKACVAALPVVEQTDSNVAHAGEGPTRTVTSGEAAPGESRVGEHISEVEYMHAVLADNAVDALDAEGARGEMKAPVAEPPPRTLGHT
eukprot:gene14709-17383_t